MATAPLPKVSALMGAYNYGTYIVEAIESAMTQAYPPECLELVIVDDGSSDNTAELVQGCIERYPGRIKFVQQQNAGATAATNRARREATGDLIALLDADDVWLPSKTIRQVELMLGRPELGLTFTRMTLVDGDGTPTFHNYGYQGPIPENGFARVLWENVAVQSSLIIEAELFDQIPASAPYADWWLALVAAQYKKVDYLADELVLYRWHGANITGGVGGTKALREAQKGIEFQRWVLRNFELDELSARLSPADMAFVWSGLENQAQKGLSGLRSHFGVLATVSDTDRDDAARDADAADAALARADYQRACLLLLRACAADPYDADLRARFSATIAEADTDEDLPDPLGGHQGFAVLAQAEFLLGDDSRLRSYAAVMGSVADAALVIDASNMDHAEGAQALGALVERCGLADAELTMIGIVGELQPSQRRRVDSAIHALYAETAGSGEALASGSGPAPPVFTPDALEDLRQTATRWRADAPT
ncbi:MAG TPA: glycosyltransferase [Solirubrobacteraceae bacterium]|nr:glycosyltransferase [Solirubrobacteraceae bacterium]